MKKRIIIFLALLVAFTSVSAVQAATLRTSSEIQTSGGTGGYVIVQSRLYKDTVYIYSGVYQYKYGVEAYMVTEEEGICTNFEIEGTYYKTYSSESFSTSADGVQSCDYHKTASTSVEYESISTVSYTQSSAFGSSRIELNLVY